MRTISIAFVCLLVGVAHAKPAPERRLQAASTPLLEGRFSIALPEGAVLEAREHSVMSADRAAEDETRAVLKVGAAHFVLMAMEMYTRADTDFAAGLQRLLDLGDRDLYAPSTPLPVAPPLRAYLATPKRVGTRDDANLIVSAYVRHPDGGVMRISFYGDPAAMKSAAEYSALAQRMLLTLAAGPRALDLRAAERAFPGVGKDKLVLSVPAGYVATTQQGPDFAVYHVREIAVIGERASACGVYLGGHFSFQYKQQGIPAADVKTITGTLLGQKADWYMWSKGPADFVAEASTPHPLSSSLTVHAFCDAATSAGLDGVRKIMATLRVAKE